MKRFFSFLYFSPPPSRLAFLLGVTSQQCVVDDVQLNNALSSFALWYNVIRPHQNLGGRTPLETWTEVDPYREHAETSRVARGMEWIADGISHAQVA